MLPFLRMLSIEGNEEKRLESFPEEWLLPSTLTSLAIKGFPNLKSLDGKGIQHLTSLEMLGIERCNKLKSLPKQGLPPSLSCLYIADCPLLRKRCQRYKGKEWPSISHIPALRSKMSHLMKRSSCHEALASKFLLFSAIIDSGTPALIVQIIDLKKNN